VCCTGTLLNYAQQPAEKGKSGHAREEDAASVYECTSTLVNSTMADNSTTADNSTLADNSTTVQKLKRERVFDVTARLASSFEFVAPVVGPLSKDELHTALEGFDLMAGFPDGNMQYYFFRVDPFQAGPPVTPTVASPPPVTPPLASPPPVAPTLATPPLVAPSLFTLPPVTPPVTPHVTAPVKKLIHSVEANCARHATRVHQFPNPSPPQWNRLSLVPLKLSQLDTSKIHEFSCWVPTQPGLTRVPCYLCRLLGST
jgi:hypothetical protein